jgi:DNA-binding NtrC family response regulator
MSEYKILIVDDEEMVRDLYQLILEKEGHTVVTCGDATTARRLVEEENCRIVFSDIGLPDVNGLELGRQLSESNPLTILYAMTGMISLYQLSSCREAGFEDYYPKPVNRTDLVAAAAHAVAKLDRWKLR